MGKKIKCHAQLALVGAMTIMALHVFGHTPYAASLPTAANIPPVHQPGFLPATESPASTPFSFVGHDNGLPVVHCPADITVSCASQAPAADLSAVSASGGCGGPLQEAHAGDVISGQTCANHFVLTRTYMAADTCGNTATCVQRIVVNDQLLPSILCPQDTFISCAADIPPVNSDAVTVADNCGSMVSKTLFTDSVAFQTCPNRFQLIRTYRVEDACGNEATCVQRIWVNDQSVSTLACPADITVTCVGDIPAIDPGAVSMTNRCNTALTVTHINDYTSDYTCPNRYLVSRVYEARDECDNLARCTQRIKVYDQEKPQLQCPKDITVSCDEQMPQVDFSPLVTSDRCGGFVTKAHAGDVVYDQVCLNRYQRLRTYKVTDLCGNTATCVQHITVWDAVAPTMTCPPDMTVACDDPAFPANIMSVIVVENCGKKALTEHDGDVIVSQQPQLNRYKIVRTYKATDLCQNEQTCSQRIEVIDEQAPVAVCPPNLTVSCAGLVPPADPTAVQVTDNCDNLFRKHLGDVVSDQTCADRFSLTRSYRVEDACGHATSCIQQIAVYDNTPPGIVCPPNSTVSCTDEALAMDVNTVTATDDCNNLVKSHVKDVVTNKVCENNYTLTRTFKVEDACGGTATCTVRIRVFNQAPPAANCPANLTVSCNAEVPPSDPGGFTFTDYCGGAVTQVLWLGDLVTNKTCENRYQISRSYRAIDACGISSVCVQKIAVEDNTAPVMTCPDPLTVSCAGEIPPASVDALGAQDNCANGKVTVYADEAVSDNTCANRYLITRTFKARDLCGNEATCTQRITVADLTPPAIECPAGITVTCAVQVPSPNTAGIQVSDNCTGTLIKRFAGDVITGQTCPNRYHITRVYEVIDQCGNSDFCTQEITVSDQKAPTITCPANTTVSSRKQAPIIDIATVTASADNCGGAVTKSHVQDQVENYICAERMQIVRVYGVSDICGNSATCQQRITIDDQIPPSGQCPANVTVACAGDIPCSGTDPKLQEILQRLQTAFVDNSGTAVWVSLDTLLPVQYCTPGKNTFGRTVRFRVSDACGNATSCTVQYSGSCFATYSQDFWGTAVSKVDSIIPVTQVLDSLLKQSWISVGIPGGCGLTASLPTCIFKALPASGPSTPFAPDSLPNCSGSLKNMLAGEILALQLNIRYNSAYRGLNLGALPLAGACMLDTAKLNALGLPAKATVQDLVGKANDYLSSRCLNKPFNPAYGEKLRAAAYALNAYWDKGGHNKPCAPGNLSGEDLAARGDDGDEALDSDHDQLRLRPNPAHTVLLVHPPALADDAELRVYNAEGRLMTRQQLQPSAGENELTIEVAAWTPGLYWLSVTGPHAVITRRFVVQR